MIKKVLRRIGAFIGRSVQESIEYENQLLAIGALLSKQQYLLHSKNINDFEFKIFSQFGDDGIIQYLIKHIKIQNRLFIEFGVENYIESNTRFLLMNNNWSGFVMDGSTEAMESLKNQPWFWKYDLTYKAVFITKENINELLGGTGFSDIGLLHVDLDGNDYHIFNEIELSKLNPSIIIVEYNSVLGPERPITVPYDKSFVRTKAHSSNLYWGASLAALQYAASKKGYALVCCNEAGNNAYFVKKVLLNDKVVELTVKEAYRDSKYREARNPDYSLSYIAGSKRYELIKGLSVINVITNQEELL